MFTMFGLLVDSVISPRVNAKKLFIGEKALPLQTFAEANYVARKRGHMALRVLPDSSSLIYRRSLLCFHVM